MIKKIILFFILWKIGIYLTTTAIDPFIKDDLVFSPKKEMMLAPYQSTPLIARFANFDGENYLQVARNGYTVHELGFFPLYPYILHFLGDINHFIFHYHFYIITAEIVSNLSLLFSIILFYKMLQFDKKQNYFPFLFIILLIYPTSFFLTAAYNDSFFLLFATSTLYFGRRRNWIPASICGAIATLIRLNGLALFFYLIIEYILQKNTVTILTVDNWRNSIQYLKKLSFIQIIKDCIWTALLIPGAFVGYLLYIQNTFGSYLLLFSSMKTWGQDKMILPPQTLWRYIKILFFFPTFKLNYWIAALEFGSVLLYLFILWYSYKKIRFSYWAFMFFSFLIPSLTGTFQGMPRYGLHVYPFFLSLTLFFCEANKLVKIIYCICSILLFLTLLALFTNGYFVS